MFELHEGPSTRFLRDFLIRAWRLVASKFADRIFSGGGAYRQGGR